jgi:hypothetical protein
MSALGWRIQPVDATPFASNLARWNGMHMEENAQTWFTRKQKAESGSAECAANRWRTRRLGARRNESGV